MSLPPSAQLQMLWTLFKRHQGTVIHQYAEGAINDRQCASGTWRGIVKRRTFQCRQGGPATGRACLAGAMKQYRVTRRSLAVAIARLVHSVIYTLSASKTTTWLLSSCILRKWSQMKLGDSHLSGLQAIPLRRDMNGYYLWS